jgi:hypothetical protein
VRQTAAKPKRQPPDSAGNVLPIGRPSLGTVPLPSLDEVADRPETVSHLPRTVVMTTLYRAMMIQQVCLAELVAGGTDGEVRDKGQHVAELLTAAEVARMMGGISPRQVYRQAKQFPFKSFSVRPTPGTVRFHRHLVEQYLRDPEAYRVRHAGAAASDPSAAASRLGRGNDSS